MFRRMILLSTFFWCMAMQAVSSPYSPPLRMTLPEYWGEEHVWWHGRASFKGQVIAPACTLAMEDIWQAIDMGETPVRDLQDSFAGPEKKFRLRLRNCELAGTGKRVYTASRVRVTFDGLRGETPDKFSLTGQAEG
ncbi:fimbrial protein, partial [Escherichia coli]